VDVGEGGTAKLAIRAERGPMSAIDLHPERHRPF